MEERPGRLSGKIMEHYQTSLSLKFPFIDIHYVENLPQLNVLRKSNNNNNKRHCCLPFVYLWFVQDIRDLNSSSI